MNSKLRRIHLQALCSIAGLLLVGLGQPLLAIAPVILHFLLFAPRAIKAFTQLSAQHRLLASLSAFLGLSLVTSLPVQAIEFSFLLQSTQQAMETCIFGQISGFIVLSGLIFTALRGGTMLGLAFVAFDAWQQKRQHQDSSEQVKTIVYALVSIIVVGAIEPLIIGGGCSVDGLGG